MSFHGKCSAKVIVRHAESEFYDIILEMEKVTSVRVHVDFSRFVVDESYMHDSCCAVWHELEMDLQKNVH